MATECSGQTLIRPDVNPRAPTAQSGGAHVSAKLVQGGVDLPTIQQISGHKTMAMVVRYTHIHGSHVDKAIAVLGGGTSLEHMQANIVGAASLGLHGRFKLVMNPKSKGRES